MHTYVRFIVPDDICVQASLRTASGLIFLLATDPQWMLHDSDDQVTLWSLSIEAYALKVPKAWIYTLTEDEQRAAQDLVDRFWLKESTNGQP